MTDAKQAAKPFLMRRDLKAVKRDRLAMKRYVALRMQEDIETCLEIVKDKAKKIRKARQRRLRAGRNAAANG